MAQRWHALGITHLTIDTRNAERAGWPAHPGDSDTLKWVVEKVRETIDGRHRVPEGDGA